MDLEGDLEEMIDLDDIKDTDTTCTLCYAEFLDPEDLEVHIKQVHSEKWSKRHPCHFCTSSFSSLESYMLHIRDVHIISMKSCKYCTRMFTDMPMYKAHELKHYVGPNSNFKCSQCIEVFSNVFNLEQHERNCHYNANDGVFLDKYYSILSSVLKIRAPMFLQSLGTSMVYICIKCELTTPNVEEYVNHLKKSNCRCFVCDNCAQVYKDKGGLKRHLQQHKECFNYVEYEDRFKECKACHKKINALLIKQHTESCKPVKCNMCNIIYSSIYELTSHQLVEHPLAVSVNACHFCQKEFVGKVSLRKHLTRVHKPFLHLYKYHCVHCTHKYFKHPKDLFAHLFSKHVNLQPYSCKICNKTFRVRKRFTIHIKLDHNSIGFVEFDQNYNVFFTDKKSENPFQPTSIFAENVIDVICGETQDIDKSDGSKTDKETDLETDVEAKQSKPPKKRFKEIAKSDINLININSDFMSATETEAVQTENEFEPARKKDLKRKAKTKSTKSKRSKKRLMAMDIIDMDTDDDDEPLFMVKKKCQKKKQKAKRLQRNFGLNKRLPQTKKDNRARLTCKICQKYCYTFQNYNHHVSMHSKNETKNCIKCSKEFRTTEELNKHMDKEHLTSKLTETLRSLLERRKKGLTNPAPQLTTTEKFQRTIKKVKDEKTTSVAQFKEVSERLSVQKFIESFTPETNENKKKNLSISTSVSVKPVYNTPYKPPMIKMTKFTPNSLTFNGKLAMPVQFKPNNLDYPKVTIKVVQIPVDNSGFMGSFKDYINNYQEESVVDNDSEEDSQQRNEIPEVAQEVMLDSEEQMPRQVLPPKIVIPNLPKGYDSIRIAQLLPEAPYYQIVKVESMKENEKEKQDEPEEDWALPSGTKLVNVNPLAHLLGDTPIESVVGKSYKYCKNKSSNNYQKAIAKALMKLDTPKKKKSTKKKDVEVEQ